MPRGERLLRPPAALCAEATAATVWLDVLLTGAGTPPDPLNWAH
ncbi:hypothetical protein [Actinomadura rubrisoli]|nr:hypothetical protein [Actinomadura rubrisoli]